MWDQFKQSQFNWLWWECVTFQHYTEETSYENSLLVQQTGALALSSLTHVLRSLTPNARYRQRASRREPCCLAAILVTSLVAIWAVIFNLFNLGHKRNEKRNGLCVPYLGPNNKLSGRCRSVCKIYLIVEGDGLRYQRFSGSACSRGADSVW